MADIEHSDITAGEIHIVYNYSYADSTARLAATGFAAGDVGKLALQLDDNSLWLLTDDSPITWKDIGTSSSSRAANPMTTLGDLIYGGASGVETRLAGGAEGNVLTFASGLPAWGGGGTLTDGDKGDITVANSGAAWTIDAGAVTAAKLATNAKTTTLVFVIDGGGSAISTGIKGDLIVDFGCTIQSVTMLADQSGSIVVDIWKDTYTNFPPTDADSITSAAVPTISTATKSQDATLTGWTTSVAAGDILRFNVDSAATVTRVTIALKVVLT